MKKTEMYVRETLVPNQKTGREFLVKFYQNYDNYSYPCKICTKPSIYRIEIYNHIYEPLWSEYYCTKCIPTIPLKEGD